MIIIIINFKYKFKEILGHFFEINNNPLICVNKLKPNFHEKTKYTNALH